MLVATAIGLNAASFTLADRLVFSQPVGIEDPANVLRITNSWLRRIDDSAHLADGVRSLEVAVQSTVIDLTLQTNAAPQVRVRYVSRNYFPVLGARLISGSGFTSGSQSPHEAVLSYNLWRQYFTDRPDITHSTFRLSGVTYLIVGVAARGFTGTDTEAVDLWLPADAAPTTADGFWPVGGLWVVGRLRGDASLDQARVELQTRYPSDAPVLGRSGDRSLNVSPVYADAWSRLRNLNRFVVLLIGASTMVLMISCANLSGLMINRLFQRRNELEIRVSLGATRIRITGLLFAEVAVVNVLAGLCGVLLVYPIAPALAALLLPPPSGTGIGSPLTPNVLVFTVLAVSLTTVLTGIVPVMQMWRHRVDALGPRPLYMRKGRVRSLLVATQVALTTILLIAAGLFVRSFRNAVDVDLGMVFENVLVATMDLHGSRNPQHVLSEMAAGVRVIPGVTHVAVSNASPISARRVGKMHVALEIPGFEWPWGAGRSAGRAQAFVEAISPEYFSVLGMKVLRGRGVLASDTVGQPPVVLVDQRLAREVFRGVDPIGKCVHFAHDPARPGELFARQCRQIVGVVSSVRPEIVRSLSGDSAPFDPVFYVPVEQWGGARHLLIRTAEDPKPLLATIKARLQNAHPESAYVTLEPLSWYHDQQTHSWRVGSALFGIYGLFALLLAGISTYSAIAFQVRQQRHEIGVRFALGATRSMIVRMTLRTGTLPVLFGLALGLLGAFGLSAVVSSLVFGVTPTDPLTTVAVVGVIGVVAVLASVLPSQDAARTDPSHLLRCE